MRLRIDEVQVFQTSLFHMYFKDTASLSIYAKCISINYPNIDMYRTDMYCTNPCRLIQMYMMCHQGQMAQLLCPSSLTSLWPLSLDDVIHDNLTSGKQGGGWPGPQGGQTTMSHIRTG